MATTTLNYTSWTSSSSTTTLDTLAGAAYWASDESDNTTNKYVDAMAAGKITFGANHVAGDTVNIFVTANYDIAIASAWTGGVGTQLDLDSAVDGDSVITVDTHFNDVNLILLAVVECSAASSVEHWGPVSVGNAFGGILPQKYGFIFENSDATATLGTGHTVGIIGLTYESA